MHELEPPIFNTFGLPHHVAFGWLVIAILIAVALAVPRRPALVPRGLQNALEAVLEFVIALIDDVIGREGRRFLPLIATLGLFIFASNLLGLVPGFTAPTDNVNTNPACALVVFFSYHWIGIRAHGLGAYLKHFAGPMPALAPLMVPIELISHLARPLSLTLRLFGNMLGGHILLSIVFFMTVGLSTWALSGAAGVIGSRDRRRGDGRDGALHRRLPVPAEAPGGVPAGVHLLHALDALHRGRPRGRARLGVRAWGPGGSRRSRGTRRPGGRGTRPSLTPPPPPTRPGGPGGTGKEERRCVSLSYFWGCL